MKIKDVTQGMPSACEYCKKEKEENGSPVDLRPYGKDGAWICFDCGMSPASRATTDSTFKNLLDGNDVIITG